jgi:hypothetical protein
MANKFLNLGNLIHYGHFLRHQTLLENPVQKDIQTILIFITEGLLSLGISSTL